MRFSILFAALFATAAQAEGHKTAYVQSNASAILYHELGHALIDILGIPVLGQEEDAADVLSILLIDQLFESETADEIAYDTAYSFQADAFLAEDQGADIQYWDVHGLDLQRYYTLVCLHYGADVDARADFADELELPQERAEGCEEERMIADDSWGPILDDIAEEGANTTLVLKQVAEPSNEFEAAYSETVAADVQAINGWLKLPEPLVVKLARCDEANAFYDPQDISITMCLEFADHLAGHLQD